MTNKPLDYTEVRQLADAATSGPWRTAGTLPAPSVRTDAGYEVAYTTYRDMGVKDAAFIAAARTAVPRLLDDHDEMARKLIELETARRMLSGRMQRIAEAHHKHVDSHGGTYGECNECGDNWPCPTYVWATSERDAGMATWDPADDCELAR